MAKLRKMLTHPRKNESGQGVLAIVLLLLMLGAVILTPLLAFMSTGLKAGQVYESKLQECYAAEAGVEDAIWKIKNGSLSVLNYSLGEEVNDRNVAVTINNTGPGIYLINSTATSDDGGSTTIESYVSLPLMNFSKLLDNAISSDGNVTIRNSVVEGNVTYVDGLNVTGPGGINGTNESVSLDWPTAAQLSAFYADDVAGHDFLYDTIDIKDYNSIGPLYRDGSLSVDRTGGSPTPQLNGIVYVTENLAFEQVGGGKKYTLDLNGQTMYAEGDITLASQHITLTGSGCIIAVGNVTLHPGMESSPDDFILVMSLTGKIDFQPTGDFYGCLAGDVDVVIKNGHLTWTDWEDKGLNFPTGDDPGIGGGNLSILSWQIR